MECSLGIDRCLRRALGEKLVYRISGDILVHIRPPNRKIVDILINFFSVHSDVGLLGVPLGHAVEGNKDEVDSAPQLPAFGLGRKGIDGGDERLGLEKDWMRGRNCHLKEVGDDSFPNRVISEIQRVYSGEVAAAGAKIFTQSLSADLWRAGLQPEKFPDVFGGPKDM